MEKTNKMLTIKKEIVLLVLLGVVFEWTFVGVDSCWRNFVWPKCLPTEPTCDLPPPSKDGQPAKGLS
jgi:hypothetical protein